MPTKQKIPVVSIQGFVMREEGRDRGGGSYFDSGLFPMEGKTDPPLTLVKINSADISGHSNFS